MLYNYKLIIIKWLSRDVISLQTYSLILSGSGAVIFKGTVMQLEKALKTDCLRVSNVSWKLRSPTINNFPVTYPWNLLFSYNVAYFLTVYIVFSVYKQNFTAK